MNANHVINSRVYLNAWFGALAKMCFYLQSYHVNFLHWTECLTRQCNYFSNPLRVRLKCLWLRLTDLPILWFSSSELPLLPVANYPYKLESTVA